MVARLRASSELVRLVRRNGDGFPPEVPKVVGAGGGISGFDSPLNPCDDPAPDPVAKVVVDAVRGLKGVVADDLERSGLILVGVPVRAALIFDGVPLKTASRKEDFFADPSAESLESEEGEGVMILVAN